MSLPSIIEIEIVNWGKYNPKRDQQSYTWLRLNNDIATDPDLYGLSAEQKFVWVEILCQASRKNKGIILLNLDQLAHVCHVQIQKVKQLIEFLQIKPICRVHDRARPPVVVGTTPTYERTNVRTNETDDTNEQTNEGNAPSCKQPEAEAPHPLELSDAHAFLIMRKVKPKLAQSWVTTFDDPDWIIQELKKASLWEDANPKKKKIDFGKFMTNWLTRGWDSRKVPSNTNRAEQRTANNRAAGEAYMKKLQGENT